MSRFFVGLALWALLLALAACGGDSKITDPARDTELAEMVDTVVSTYDDLTVCTDKREGATAYVEDEDSAYVCKKGLWAVDDSLTKAIRPDLEEKSSSSAKAKSSSNETSDSSSKAKSSSSKDGKSNSSSSSVVTIVSVASPCKTETEDNCEYGSLTDDRDGQTYKTVKIGEQWWMAENLNYETKTTSDYCLYDSAEYCEKYGRLYTWWGTAMVVCPEGWHLPSRDEWNTLLTAAGGERIAGIMLKSTEGWNYSGYYVTSGNGSDSYFFSALPAGYRNYDGDFDDEGDDANFWSSTEYGSYDAYVMSLYYNSDRALLSYYGKDFGFSVRCLRD